MKKFSLVLAFLFLPSLAFAQFSQSFSAKPTFPNKDLPYQFTIQAKPNSTDTENLTIYNTASTPTTFVLSGVDSAINDKGEIFFKLSTDQQTTAGQWIVAPKDPITIPANGQAQLDFQVKIPSEVEKKDYLGGISVEAENVGTVNKNGQNLSVNLRDVVRVNIKVTDTPQPVEKLPTPAPLSPTQIYLGISIFLFIAVCCYFAFHKIQTNKKHTHRQN